MARWAYFFGPGCEPGLRELGGWSGAGGAAFVVDIDPTRSTFGGWFREWLPDYDPVAVQRFWADAGLVAHRARPAVGLRRRRADLEAVVRIELLAAEWRDRAPWPGHPGLTVDYAANLWWRLF